VSGSDSCPGGQLTGVAEEFQIRKLGEEDLTGDVTNAGNTREQFMLAMKYFVSFDNLVDA